jgi:hypothetical protein
MWVINHRILPSTHFSNRKSLKAQQDNNDCLEQLNAEEVAGQYKHQPPGFAECFLG